MVLGFTLLLTLYVVFLHPLFLVGAALASFLYADGRFFTPNVSSWQSMIYLGAAMSVTAFPVLARILEERGLSRTHLGTTAIACAAAGVTLIEQPLPDGHDDVLSAFVRELPAIATDGTTISIGIQTASAPCTCTVPR